MAEDSQECLMPGCSATICVANGLPNRWRGLCLKHYGQAKRLVDNGLQTWEKLVELGLATDESESDFAREVDKRLKGRGARGGKFDT
jgi:hypothetical protein